MCFSLCTQSVCLFLHSLDKLQVGNWVNLTCLQLHRRSIMGTQRSVLCSLKLILRGFLLGLVKSSQLRSNLPNILKPIVLRGFVWQIYLPKPSLLHLWAIWCLELTTKLIVFTQQNYLNIAANLLPQWSLFWSDIICKCLIGLHNLWMRKCTVTPPLPLQPLWDNSAVGCDPLPHLFWRSFSTVWVCPGG